MGYYLNSGEAFGKAKWLVEEHGGRIVSKKIAEFLLNNPSVGVVVVMDNGMFDAAGFAYDINEFKAFTQPDDIRPKTFLVMDRKLCEQLSGFDL